MTKQTTEIVPFRVMSCQHCKHVVCWVNSRPPTYCPECGKLSIGVGKFRTMISDPAAVLKYRALEP